MFLKTPWYYLFSIRYKNVLIRDSEWKLKIKTNSVEIDYKDESIWTELFSRWKVLTAFIFSNNAHDIYSLIQEDSDNNWMFRALSRSTFGLAEYHKDIKFHFHAILKLTKNNLKNLLLRILT